MPFEDADFVNVISEKWAQQDEQCIQRLAPTNHDVSVKGDRGVYAGISLRRGEEEKRRRGEEEKRRRGEEEKRRRGEEER
jgi:hypothetical protein